MINITGSFKDVRNHFKRSDLAYFGLSGTVNSFRNILRDAVLLYDNKREKL